MQTQIYLQLPCLSLSPFPSSTNDNSLFYSKPYNSKNKPLFLCSFSSVSSSPTPTHSLSISTPTSNPSLYNFLVETLAFSKPRALSISNRFASRKSIEKPQSVVQFLKQHGFSDEHIRSTIRIRPNILFANVDKNLKPKLHFFQDLGLTGPLLGNFISTNPSILNLSLERKLIPCFDIIKKTLANDKNIQNLIRVLQWSYSNPSVSRLKSNIAFLESCGIVGSQFSYLLKKQPRLLFLPEPALRDLVSRVVDMGLSADSRMFVYALYSVGVMSRKGFSRKIEMLRSFGFSMDECMDIFRRSPRSFTSSDDHLKFKIDFFLNDFKLDRRAFVSWPSCLTYSIEKRIVPRYRVLRVLMSKGLLQKEPSFKWVLTLSEEKFLGKFISRFSDDAEEILEIYKGGLLDS